MDYKLIDSGEGLKLEKFGNFKIIRPCPQAIWKQKKEKNIWNQADATFTREPENRWIIKKAIPDFWHVTIEGIKFKLSLTEFGHLGIFPEQISLWNWLNQQVTKQNRQIEVLNLFAYSGGSTLACARAGAKVCHLDASKGMVAWAKENADLNGLSKNSIRWIVDDVKKFLNREVKRGHRYDAIILDPPSFGRGASGEVFKIEKDLLSILEKCQELLTDNPCFFLFSCHSNGFSPMLLNQLFFDFFHETGETGEMCLVGDVNTFLIPSGSYAKWSF